MATASPPPNPDSETSQHRTIITITALVAILTIVILLALYGKKNSPHRRLREMQLQNELQRSGHRRRRRKQPSEQGLEPSLLQYIPVVKFDSPSPGERRTRSLDLEKGRVEEGTDAWSLAQSQLRIKAMQAEMSEIGQSLHVNEKNTNSKKLQDHFEQHECTICTQPFVQGELVRNLPCGHVHHQTCVDQWLVGFSGTCPVWSVVSGLVWVTSC